MSQPGTLVWLVHHESRLAWRDWLSMITAGRRRRTGVVTLLVCVFILLMHLLAYSMVGRFADIGIDSDKLTLVVLSGSLLLSWALMVSQAMESVTRAFYARSDLDLILSSPLVARKLFSVRIAAMAASVVLMATLLAAPFIDVLAFRGGARWLGAYGIVAASGLTATALAVALTVALFRLIGPKRTRLIAQIVSAVIGAGFVIGLQLAAIMSDDSLSRIDILKSDAFVSLAPECGSVLYWPALAVLGDPTAVAAVLAGSLGLIGLAIVTFSPRFGDYAISASGHATGTSAVPAARHDVGSQRFRRTTRRSVLRQKEWMLLRRDPWLMSQTLMQILYLLPPAVLLSRSFDDGTRALLVLVPVLVMASGQLAGGLAWLAISGEDAPDLVATAPLRASQVVRAKIEAVMGVIALVFAPFVLALALLSFAHAVAAALGIVAAAAAATQIQLWFRGQAKRSQFRRRQVSSRVATFAEAFSSITWAATAALACAGTWLAAITAVVALGILFAAWLTSPPRP